VHFSSFSFCELEKLFLKIITRLFFRIFQKYKTNNFATFLLDLFFVRSILLFLNVGF
jgi:hypothetical protein